MRSAPRARRLDWRSSQGQVSAGIVLVIVLAAVGTSAALLGRTLGAAQSINAKADNIAQTGQGINTATDSVIQLTRTNELAESILGSADPLEGQLDEVVALARAVEELAASINGHAGTINGTAGSINGTAGTINATAGGINSTAVGILDVARRIDQDVININDRLDTTIVLVNAIKGDTANILSTAVSIHQNAACIDGKVSGSSSGDGHC